MQKLRLKIQTFRTLCFISLNHFKCQLWVIACSIFLYFDFGGNFGWALNEIIGDHRWYVLTLEKKLRYFFILFILSCSKTFSQLHSNVCTLFPALIELFYISFQLYRRSSGRRVKAGAFEHCPTSPRGRSFASTSASTSPTWKPRPEKTPTSSISKIRQGISIHHGPISTRLLLHFYKITKCTFNCRTT